MLKDQVIRGNIKDVQISEHPTNDEQAVERGTQSDQTLVEIYEKNSVDQRTPPLRPFLEKKKPYYNPNMGYEPYWTQGEWVFELPRDRNLSISTTKWPTVCGEECVYLYTRIGKVCAHKSDDVTYAGCSGFWSYIWGCTGVDTDDMTYGFVTFDTYCKFLDAQCKSYFDSKWVFVHLGPCLSKQELWFKPVDSDTQPVSRLKSYLSTLSTVFQNLTITAFG